MGKFTERLFSRQPGVDTPKPSVDAPEASVQFSAFETWGQEVCQRLGCQLDELKDALLKSKVSRRRPFKKNPLSIQELFFGSLGWVLSSGGDEKNVEIVSKDGYRVHIVKETYRRLDNETSSMKEGYQLIVREDEHGKFYGGGLPDNFEEEKTSRFK